MSFSNTAQLDAHTAQDVEQANSQLQNSLNDRAKSQNKLAQLQAQLKQKAPTQNTTRLRNQINALQADLLEQNKRISTQQLKVEQIKQQGAADKKRLIELLQQKP